MAGKRGRAAVVEHEEPVEEVAEGEQEARPGEGARVPLATALAMAEHLAVSARVLQEQMDEWVLVARSGGASWAQIGEAIGMDRSAALRRYRRLHDPVWGEGRGPGMRLTVEAQGQVLVEDAADARHLAALERAGV